MSTFSSLEFDRLFGVPFRSLEYRDTGIDPMTSKAIDPLTEEQSQDSRKDTRPEVELTEAEFAERIRRERADAAQQTEQRLSHEYEAKLQAARAPIATSVSGFEAQRDEYYARVEAEVVQLALAIAAKILHREAQVDPTLVASLVRITVEKLREESKVSIRVGAGRGRQWEEYFARSSSVRKIEIVEDPQLSEHDVLLETELGVANFGLATQLKEVEQGFFDLLALRPVNR